MKQFLHHLIPQKLLTFLLLLMKVHVSANSHIALLILSLMTTYQRFDFLSRLHLYPQLVKNALNHPGWHNVMLEEIHALDESHACDLLGLSKGKKLVWSNWYLQSKLILTAPSQDLRPNLRLKTMLGLMGVDYFDTFSLVGKLTFVPLFISLVASQHWPSNLLDMKNAILPADLSEKKCKWSNHLGLF